MSNFKERRGGFRSSGRSGGGSNFQKNSWGDRGRTEARSAVMHRATCSNCGQSCEVPFRPTGEKPIYCSDCFSQVREGSQDRFSKRDFSARPPRRDFDNRDRRDGRDNRPTPTAEGGISNHELKKQLEAANVKLDRLLRAVEEMSLARAVKEVMPQAESLPKPKKMAKEAVKPSIIKKAIRSKSPALKAVKVSAQKKK